MSIDQNIRRQVQELTPNEQLQLLEELATLVRQQIGQTAPVSIMQLAGLGEEIWQGIDAQAYVDQERDSWNG